MYIGTKSSPVKGLFDESEIDQTDEPIRDSTDPAVFDHAAADCDPELASEIAAEQDAAEEDAEQGKPLPRSSTAIQSTKRIYLSKAEELDLILRWQKHRDHQARSKLLDAFWCKISSFAMAYFAGPGMDRDDKISLARIGFLKGVDKFKPSLGKRLWTCAKYWIRDALGEPVRKSHSQTKRSRPRPIIAAAKRIILREWHSGKRGAELYEAVLARFGGDTDLAKYGNALSSAEYAEAEALAFNRSGEFSLNTPIDDGGDGGDDDGDGDLGSGFVDDSDDGPDRSAWTTDVARKISILIPLERSVIEARLTNKTLDEIGTDLGVCGEYVRQIEARAVTMLAAELDEQIDCRPHSNDRAFSQRLSWQTRALLKAVTKSIIRHWDLGSRGDPLCRAVQAEFITFNPLQSRRMQEVGWPTGERAAEYLARGAISLINHHDYNHALTAAQAITRRVLWQEEVARHIVERARRRNEWPAADLRLRPRKPSPCDSTPRLARIRDAARNVKPRLQDMRVAA